MSQKSWLISTPSVFTTPILSHFSTSFCGCEQRTKPITTWRTQDRHKKKSGSRQSRQSSEREADEHKGSRGRRKLEYYATYVYVLRLVVMEHLGTLGHGAVYL